MTNKSNHRNYDDVTNWLEQQNWDGKYDELITKFKAHFERKAIVVGITYENIEDRNKIYPVYHVIVRHPSSTNQLNFTVKKLYYTKFINQFDDYSFSENGLARYFKSLQQTESTAFLIPVYQNAIRTKTEIRQIQKSLFSQLNPE